MRLYDALRGVDMPSLESVRRSQSIDLDIADIAFHFCFFEIFTDFRNFFVILQRCIIKRIYGIIVQNYLNFNDICKYTCHFLIKKLAKFELI